MRRRIGVVLGVVLAMLVALVVAGAGSSGANPAPMGPTCNGTYSNVTFGTLIVPSWGSCKLSNSTVTGAVLVNSNAEYDACNVAMGGSVNATQAYVNIDNESTVTGSITLTQPGSTVSIGGSPCSEKGPYGYSAYICPHYVGGSINVSKAPYNNYLEVSIGECGLMTVHGNVTIQNNQQLVEIDDATIVGSLICTNNWPAAMADDVTVGGAKIGCGPVYCS